VVGSRDFIWRARRARKLVGGGLRQAGVLAAPGLIALRDGPAGMIERLAEDHANARRLGEGIAELPGVVLDPSRIRTNFVLFRLRSASGEPADDRRLARQFPERLAAHGVWMIDYDGKGVIRAVTHHGITPDDIDRAIAATRAALEDLGVIGAAHQVGAAASAA
jgi:threonine aldolase